MAAIKPVVSNSQALITPGYPLASVAMANPHAATEIKAGQVSTPVSTARKTALTQSGHTSDSVI